MVRRRRFELRLCGFSMLLYVSIATFLCCSLDYVFTMPFGLGSQRIVSTHLGITSIQHGVALTFHRFSQLLLLSFPTRHSPLQSVKEKVRSLFQLEYRLISHFLYLLYTKIPRKSKFQRILWQNTQSTNALFVGILNAGSRAPYIPFSYFRKFSLEEWKTTNYRRFISSSNGCNIYRHCRVYLLRCTCRRILRPDMCV